MGLSFIVCVCLCHTALWSPAGKALLYVMLLFFCFFHFPTRYPASGVVLDCIYSLSLPSTLLYNEKRASFTS